MNETEPPPISSWPALIIRGGEATETELLPGRCGRVTKKPPTTDPDRDQPDRSASAREGFPSPPVPVAVARPRVPVAAPSTVTFLSPHGLDPSLAKGHAPASGRNDPAPRHHLCCARPHGNLVAAAAGHGKPPALL